ncbi:hypothetical protein ACX0G9_00500 [Flavitalea flava]
MKPFLMIIGLITGSILSLQVSCYAQSKQDSSVAQSKPNALNPVAVSKEPRHHNVFENAWVRVLDVHIGPGDTSFFHKHETPSVFIVLSNVKTGSEVIIEEKKTNAPVTFGNIWFDGFYTQPRIHRVWNEDTSEFHVMDIELLNRRNKLPVEINPDSPIKNTAFQLLFDELPVRGYLLNLQPRTHFSLQERTAPVLVVLLTDSPEENPPRGDPGKNILVNNILVNGKPFSKKGDYLFIPAKKKIEFINRGLSAGKLALFELK